MQQLALCGGRAGSGAGGRQCWEGTLELLFGIVSKLSQPKSSLGAASAPPFAWSRNTASPPADGHGPSQGWHRHPTSTLLEGQATKGLSLCHEVPVLGRAKPAGNRVRNSWFCKAET